MIAVGAIHESPESRSIRECSLQRIFVISSPRQTPIWNGKTNGRAQRPSPTISIDKQSDKLKFEAQISNDDCRVGACSNRLISRITDSRGRLSPQYILKIYLPDKLKFKIIKNKRVGMETLPYNLIC